MYFFLLVKCLLKKYFSPQEKDIDLMQRIANIIIERKNRGYTLGEPVQMYLTMVRVISGEQDVWKCDAGRYHLTTPTLNS